MNMKNLKKTKSKIKIKNMMKNKINSMLMIIDKIKNIMKNMRIKTKT